MSTVISNINSAVRPEEENPGLARDRMYQLMIEVTGDDAIRTQNSEGQPIFPIIGNLPERFTTEISADWATPYAQASLGSMTEAVTGSQLIGQGVEAAAGAAGVGTRAKGQFVKVWERTSGLQMNFDLQFYAAQYTKREIRDRHLALMKLCAPSTKLDQVLMAPGPTVLGENGVISGRQINVYVGTYMTLRNVVVDSVSNDMVTLMDKNGIPIGMSVNLSISTWHDCVTCEDLDEIFGQAGG